MIARKNLAIGHTKGVPAALNDLRTHRYMVRAALAAANLFGWIFIFQFYYARSHSINLALISTALLYSVVQDVTLLATPASARALGHGAARLMTTAVVLAAAAYALLYLSFVGAFGQFVVTALVVFALLRGLYRALYWVPYNVEAPHGARPSSLFSRGPEMLVAFVPLFAGLILTSGFLGVKIILLSAIVLLLLSIPPLRRVPEKYERFSWGYLETFSQLVSHRHRTLAFTSFLDGMAGAAMLLFWPIAVFLILGWSYALLGVAMTMTYLIVLIARDQVRWFMRRIRIEESAVVHAALAASSWIFRLTVATPLGIVLVDSYFLAGTPIRGSGIDRLSFDQAADKGSFIDEYTALKEMAMAAGKIIMCLVAVFVANHATVAATLIIIFVLAALASASSVYYARTAIR